MHAGLLGHDSIIMLDEAHLSPAMAVLIRDINRIQHHAKFRTMTLSATNINTNCVFGLIPGEEADPLVHKRLHAVKRSEFHSAKNRAGPEQLHIQVGNQTSNWRNRCIHSIRQ